MSWGVEASFSFLNLLDALPPYSATNYILLIGDPFNKRHEAVAVLDQSVPTIAKAPVDHWISRLDCSKSIHSDQGRNFEAQLSTTLSMLLAFEKRTELLSIGSPMLPWKGNVVRSSI